MDIRCTTCGEPWDTDSIHDEIASRNPEKPWYQEERPVYSEGFIGNSPFTNAEGRWYNTEVYEKEYWKPARKEFTLRGCEFFGSKHSEYPIGNVAAIAALSDLLGDDIDGLASMLEDFNL
jgi:hypothetical protein